MMTFHLGSSMDLKMETMMMMTANGLSGQQMDLALNHVDMEFKNTNE